MRSSRRLGSAPDAVPVIHQTPSSAAGAAFDLRTAMELDRLRVKLDKLLDRLTENLERLEKLAKHENFRVLNLHGLGEKERS